MQEVVIFIRHDPKTGETTVEQFADHVGESYAIELGLVAYAAIQHKLENADGFEELPEARFDPSNN